MLHNSLVTSLGVDVCLLAPYLKEKSLFVNRKIKHELP